MFCTQQAGSKYNTHVSQPGLMMHGSKNSDLWGTLILAFNLYPCPSISEYFIKESVISAKFD